MALCSWAADELPPTACSGRWNTGQLRGLGYESIHPSILLPLASWHVGMHGNVHQFNFFLSMPRRVEVQMGPGLSLEINCGFALIYLALFAVHTWFFFYHYLEGSIG